jgi:hypothetical protein
MARLFEKSSSTPLSAGLIQRQCDCGKSAGSTGECEECKAGNENVQENSNPEVKGTMKSSGHHVNQTTSTFMRSRFGRDFSNVQAHTIPQPTMDNDDNRHGMLLPGSASINPLAIQPQADETNEANLEEGIEVGDQLMYFPDWKIVSLPTDTTALQPQADVSTCDKPTTMRKVISGSFEGNKTMDDYFPDLVGKGFWGKNNVAGPFDNGARAGSSVQLIGEYPSPCSAGGSAFTLGQTATIKRARADGKKLMENGKPLEGQTIDDIKRSGRDQSKPPFRQEFDFAVSMADPISGIPYKTLKSYEWEVDLTSSLSGTGGSKSVNWGVTVEASGGTVTKNEVR